MKTKIVQIAFCLLLAAVLCFGQLSPVLSQTDFSALAAAPVKAATAEEVVPSEQTEGVVRPEDIDEGLSVNSLQDIRGRRVTVRQPVMEVLDYNVERPSKVEVLSDTYVLKDLTTRTELNSLAKVTFEGSLEDKENPRYPMRGLNNSPKDGGPQTYFSEFEKYMLLRQAYYFNLHAMDIVKDGKLAKHPAADGIYGKIPDSASAVRMHIVTDPIYRSPMTTGLYLVPGEVATVKIKGLAKGETLQLYTHHQDTMGYLGTDGDGKGFGKMEDYLAYWDDVIVKEAERAQQQGGDPDFEQYKYGLHGQWVWQNQKVPCMGTKFNIVGTGEDMEVKIGSMYGGPLYMQPTESSVDMEISGAVLTPHFVLGVTTVEEFDEQLRTAPGLIATLDVENGQLIGPAEDMRKCDDIEKLAYFWHSVFAIDISLNGRAYNYNMTMCYDIHVPAGEAVALNSNFCSQPTYWFPVCMNYETLTTKGNWGTFHELGHVQAKTHGVNWGFCDGDGEVWNNTLILLIYSMLCNMDNRLVGVEHGEFVHPYTAIARSQTVTKEYTDKETGETKKINDYSEINNGKGEYFDQLSMYASLLHSFGSQKFVDMFYTYKLNPAYCDNKRADFVYRIALVDRVNILKWVNGNYFANIDKGMFSKSQWEFINTLPDFYPVAYRWANGIDGHETARKYEVDGKLSTVFDLNGDNITSPVKVDIVEVTNARFGKAEFNETTKKVTYTPPKEIKEYDSFDIIVRTDGGRQVSLNVNLRLIYRGIHTEVWSLGTTAQPSIGSRPNVEQAMSYVQNKQPDSTESSSNSYLSFNHPGVLEYFRTTFRFRADKTGEYKFYLRSDDAATVIFSKDGQEKGKLQTNDYTSAFSENRVLPLQLTEGDILSVEMRLVNWGGQGYIYVGMKEPGSEEIVNIPSANLINPALTNDEISIADSFKGWQPQFVDSIKDATIDYKLDKTGWQVLEAPTSENGTGSERLVDGDENTFYHSKYTGQKVETPHVFVFDMQQEQTVNFFEIVRRGNVNDKLTSIGLYALAGSSYDATHMGGTSTDGWTKLFDGATDSPNSLRYRVTFEEASYRYFKLIVRANTSVTVIKEVFAGLQSNLNQTVKPSNFVTENGNNGFSENSANGKLTSTAKGSQFTFEFLGDGFEVFADTDPSYGSAKITVDGTDRGTISLKDKPLFNKCVFKSGYIQTKMHTVSIVADSDENFNISFINVVYGTPVAANEFPTLTTADGKDDFGDTSVGRQFSREWRTFVKDYKTLTSIKFLRSAPSGYDDTFIRMDTYIRVYRSGSSVAFVYPGDIIAPIECGSLFAGCSALTELVLDNFDTSLMRGAMSMFYGCSSLGKIDLSNVETANTLSFGTMFGNCTSLTEADLSTFDLDSSANINRIFDSCTSLKTIKLPQTFSGELTTELPYVYMDETTHEYSYTLTLNSSTAGHELQLHDQHQFNSAGEHPAIAPTCTADGSIAYKTCSLCNCNFDFDNQKDLIMPEDIAVPATGHDTYPVPGFKMATCEEAGGEYQMKCFNCGEIVEEGDVMQPTGHWYMLDTDEHKNGYTMQFLDDGKAVVTIYFVCYNIHWVDLYSGDRCNHKKTVQFTIDYAVHQEATCILDEFYTYEYLFTEADVLAALNPSDKEIEDGMANFHGLTVSAMNQVGNALEHDWQNVAAIPASCLSHGSTEGRICSRCNVTEGFAPTAPKGHTMQYVEALEPTCAHQGHKAGQMCSECGYTEDADMIIPALGHKPVTLPGKKPTCTETGLTEGSECSVCHEILIEQQTLEALGHSEEGILGREPTETTPGLTEGKRCGVCGKVLEEQKEIPAIGSSTQPGTTPGTDPGSDPSTSHPSTSDPGSSNPGTAGSDHDGGGKQGIGTAALVGICVGSALAAAAVVTSVLVVLKRRKHR